MAALWVLFDGPDLFALYWGAAAANADADVLRGRSRDGAGIETMRVRVQGDPIFRR